VGLINEVWSPHRLTNEKLGYILSDLDSADHMVRRCLYQDLKRRVASHAGCCCFQLCAKQLWFCDEIGLGTDRNEESAAKRCSHCTDGMWDTQEYMELVNDKYDDPEKASKDDRLSRLAGYKTASATTSVTKYRESRRLREAEDACRRDLEAREQSMGPQSRAYLS